MLRSDRRVIGLDLGTGSVKLSHVRIGKQGVELLGAGQARVPEGAIGENGVADPELVAGCIKEALTEAGVGRLTRETVAAVPGRYLTARVLTVPTMDHSELGEAVKWEIAQYLPYPVEEAALAHAELGAGSSTGTLEVLTISTRSTVVEGIIRAVELAGLEPIALDAVPLALGRVFVPESGPGSLSLGGLQAAAASEGPAEAAVGIADLGGVSTEVSIFRRGQLRVSRSIPIGVSRFTAALAGVPGLGASATEQTAMDWLDLTAAWLPDTPEAAANGAARLVAEDLGNEIQRSLDYFRAQSHWLPVHRLVLTGDGARIKGLDRFLAEQLGIDVEVGDLQAALPISLGRNARTADLSAVSLGLALWEVSQA